MNFKSVFHTFAKLTEALKPALVSCVQISQNTFEVYTTSKDEWWRIYKMAKIKLNTQTTI